MLNRALTTLAILLLFGCSANDVDPIKLRTAATIYPDYSDVHFPCNIAPISFRVVEPGDKYHLEVSCNQRVVYNSRSRSGYFSIPKRVWRKVVSGSEFEMAITVVRGKQANRYAPIVNHVDRSPIDQYLSYRRLYPSYESWSKMGIYQRDLTSYKERVVMDNHNDTKTCVNCHSYANHTTQNSMIHFRGANGGTIVKHNGRVEKLSFNDSKKLISEGTYPAWHPSTNYIAYSTNDVGQNFHLHGQKVIEVSDLSSDIIIYDVANNVVIADSLLYQTEELETFPEWSRDGKHLYYVASDRGRRNTSIDSIHYNLYSVDFDAATGRLSNKRMIFDAATHGLSVSHPKATACGRYIVASVGDYGSFMVWHPEADLAIFDLESGRWRMATEINSEWSEGYHSFSSSGDWMVVSSRRGDGTFTLPYFTRFDSRTASFTKPLLMPQQSAKFYERNINSYNIPNFTTDRFTSQRDFLDMTRQASTLVKVSRQ